MHRDFIYSNQVFVFDIINVGEREMVSNECRRRRLHKILMDAQATQPPTIRIEKGRQKGEEGERVSRKEVRKKRERYSPGK